MTSDELARAILSAVCRDVFGAAMWLFVALLGALATAALVVACCDRLFVGG